jgi:acyl-CoA synthetase (AMP-forming)/AMP-acid ligase II
MSESGRHRRDTIPDLAVVAADQLGDRLALADGPTRFSYSELFDQARTFAASLVASGIEPGHRVAIWAGNSAEWVVAALGLFQAGAVLVPINTRFKGAEAADLLYRSHARALITVSDFLGMDYVAMLEATGVELPDLATTVVARAKAPVAPHPSDGEQEPSGGEREPSAAEGTQTWQSFLARATNRGRAEVDRRRASLTGDDPSDILFTSGTTGRPKGVVQTHGRTLRVATDWVAMTGLGADDRYLMVNPYFHMFGLKAGILACVASGAAMLPEAVFDAGRVLARVAEERVTVLPGPPTLYQAILDHADRDRYDISSLRVAVTGAADIPVELIRRAHDELPFSTIITGYGLTEGGTATATSPSDDIETIAATVGRPRPGFELRIVDGGGENVEPGAAGEIWLRGGSVMSHYLDDPESTAEALSADGWLRTGDIGMVNESGCLRIVGRIKDMFIVGGFNAYPAEIEDVLLRHTSIEQAAVIGVPDERLGEVGMAFVVLRRGAAVAGAEIMEWCHGQMANYKVPRAVELVDELPLNATGKVMKDVLRERAAQGRSISKAIS